MKYKLPRESHHKVIRDFILNIYPPEDKKEFSFYIKLVSHVFDVDPSYVRSIIREIKFNAEPLSIKEYAKDSEDCEPTFRFGYYILINQIRYNDDLSSGWPDENLGSYIEQYFTLYARKKGVDVVQHVLKLAKEYGAYDMSVETMVGMLGSEDIPVVPIEPSPEWIKLVCLESGCCEEDLREALEIWRKGETEKKEKL